MFVLQQLSLQMNDTEAPSNRYHFHVPRFSRKAGKYVSECADQIQVELEDSWERPHVFREADENLQRRLKTHPTLSAAFQRLPQRSVHCQTATAQEM